MKRPGMFVWNFLIRRLKSWPNDCNISTQHCWPSICKPQPNNHSISTHYIATYLLGATCCMHLVTLLWRVATCCELKIEQLCMLWYNTVAWTWLQHHTTSTIVWNIWPLSNLSQQNPTRRNIVAKRTQHVVPQQCCDLLLGNVAIVWSGLKGDQ